MSANQEVHSLCGGGDGVGNHSCLALTLCCRWGATAAELGGRLDLLVGDALLAAAVVNYLGPFPGDLGTEFCGATLRCVGVTSRQFRGKLDCSCGAPEPRVTLGVVHCAAVTCAAAGAYRSQLLPAWCAGCRQLGIPASCPFSLSQVRSGICQINPPYSVI